MNRAGWDAKLYEEALNKAGNKHFIVKIFQNADHSLRQKANGVYRFVPGVFDLVVDWLSELKKTRDDKNNDWPELRGPYFGQKIPNDKPLLFPPGIISLEGEMVHDTPVFSPDGREIYWGKFSTNPNHTAIKYSKLARDIWTKPELVSFSSLDSCTACVDSHR